MIYNFLFPSKPNSTGGIFILTCIAYFLWFAIDESRHTEME